MVLEEKNGRSKIKILSMDVKAVRCAPQGGRNAHSRGSKGGRNAHRHESKVRGPKFNAGMIDIWISTFHCVFRHFIYYALALITVSTDGIKAVLGVSE